MLNSSTPQKKMAKIIENQHLDFERFFHSHYRALFLVGYQLTADKEWTKDLLQSFFLELWEHRFQSKNIQYLEAYLKKAFHRKVVKALKKKKSIQQRTFDQVQVAPTPSYETLLINFQHTLNRRQALNKAIQQLPPQQNKALKMRFHQGLDYQEIAATTGKSTQTIYNQIHQALRKLKTLLSKDKS